MSRSVECPLIYCYVTPAHQLKKQFLKIYLHFYHVGLKYQYNFSIARRLSVCHCLPVRTDNNKEADLWETWESTGNGTHLHFWLRLRGMCAPVSFLKRNKPNGFISTRIRDVSLAQGRHEQKWVLHTNLTFSSTREKRWTDLCITWHTHKKIISVSGWAVFIFEIFKGNTLWGGCVERKVRKNPRLSPNVHAFDQTSRTVIPQTWLTSHSKQDRWYHKYCQDWKRRKLSNYLEK